MLYQLLVLGGVGFAIAAPLIAGEPMPNISGFNAALTGPSRGGRARCASGIIPVTATAPNFQLNFPLPQNQSQVTETFVGTFSAGSSLTRQTLGAPRNVSGTYNIGATICFPANGTLKSTIQILSHGVGFDRYYWDFAPGYSYVDFAADQGYATFLYDRLGVGQSVRPDPLSVVQTPLEVAILAQLTRELRTIKTFQQIIGVGHSFGSILTQSVTNTFPQLFDAAVLTGFSGNGTGNSAFFAGNNFAIASENSPYRFAGLDNGYVVASSAISTQYAFFKAPNFDPKIVAAADAQKETLTFGEFFTQSTTVKPAASFTGPVALVNGLNDLPFCDGNCTADIDITRATRAALYPAARNVTGSQPTFNVPLTGHGINLHYSANTAYQFIQDFLKAAGF